jgi:hypothetical protein
VDAPADATRAAIPLDNPQTPAKIALGRRLFFDGRLSADGTVACSTCHDPARAFTDGRPTSIGIRGRVGQRNAPTILNAVYNRTQFWDAPKGIRHGHFPDQCGDLGVDGRAAGGGPAGDLGPVRTEAALLPAQDGVGGDDHGLSPAGPDPGHPDPEKTIRRAKPGPGCRPLVHGEVLTQGEVLDRKLAVAAAEERSGEAGGEGE